MPSLPVPGRVRRAAYGPRDGWPQWSLSVSAVARRRWAIEPNRLVEDVGFEPFQLGAHGQSRRFAEVARQRRIVVSASAWRCPRYCASARIAARRSRPGWVIASGSSRVAASVWSPRSSRTCPAASIAESRNPSARRAASTTTGRSPSSGSNGPDQIGEEPHRACSLRRRDRLGQPTPDLHAPPPRNDGGRPASARPTPCSQGAGSAGSLRGCAAVGRAPASGAAATRTPATRRWRRHGRRPTSTRRADRPRRHGRDPAAATPTRCAVWVGPDRRSPRRGDVQPTEQVETKLRGSTLHGHLVRPKWHPLSHRC